MAGTDTTKTYSSTPGPVIILVEPQLGENIGMAARAMLNCGLLELRLVKPRDGWPSDKALAAASGADAVIKNAVVFDTTSDAIADLERVFATTARPRDMTCRVITPTGAAKEIQDFTGAGGQGDNKAGILFGREAKGLKNDDLSLSDALIMIPVNPAFSSLNLAQAVFAVGHEWFRLSDDTPESELAMPKATRPAEKAELEGLFEHLEGELDEAGFFHVTEMRPGKVRNLRNMFQRAGLTEQEVRTLRGVVTSLATKRKK
ncbi:MAG: RNA methyltransferase [Proteobacteria bacterium]|nr:RNA methyltransferase [Pseudomonadota bacterium]MDA1023556.1 RNA methyltransferase [Pseudomonadota bacterium]